ncbi:dolichyl-phosphate beta-glucosyltransferase [Phlebotomus argentipes]|uniref:dolichyl-phosphate beta-glucosyltransferase n=1 Tax=Phlebotomus argentipes TaxID=94469 RepID=UPI0028937EF2|nr:dolichyl-phosphate beta-glucosyltransferase [Phlebotomus argentipes]
MDVVEYIKFYAFVGSALSVGFLIGLFIILKYMTTPYPRIFRHKNEKYYVDAKTQRNIDFPSIDSDEVRNGDVDLSVIVPAYNEEERLGKMLDEALLYLRERQREQPSFRFEIIVVSDGSRDKTVDVAQSYSKEHGTDCMRVLALVQNRGKGGAVRLGVLSARGKYILFADADGATHFPDYGKLEASLQNLVRSGEESAVVIGSRAHLEQESIAQRSAFRTFLMYGFHTLVWVFGVRGIKDTQCGFKLFTRQAASTLFRLMHVERWAFDVEILFLAQSLGMKIEEVAVNWTEIEGSKVTPVFSWLQMAKDLLLIWFRYATNIWRKTPQPKDHSD